MKTSIVILSIFLLILSSCVSFNRKMIKDDLSVMKNEYLLSIDGQYEFNGYEHVSASGKKSDQVTGIARMLKLDHQKLDHCDKLIIRSSRINEKKTFELQFSLLKNDSLQYSFTYKAKLKRGMLLLQNYTSKCHGVPYIFGGCQSFQSRIGLTKNNDLLIQDYYDNTGAFLFFMWAGYTINYAEKFKRIQ